MADKNKIIIFDDGTDASKVLEFECQQNPSVEIQKVKVKNNPQKIESYIKEVAPIDDKQVTCYLPFTIEDFKEYDVDGQRKEIASKYPNVGVFYAYEFMSNEVVQQRAEGYGLKKEKEAVAELEGEVIIGDEESKKSKSKGNK